MKRGGCDPAQDELALSSVRAHAIWPGRSSLRVAEVAKELCITEQQVIDLIQEYQDTGGKGGLAAVDTASGLKSKFNPTGNKTPRSHWRIPVSAFDAFVNARKNS